MLGDSVDVSAFAALRERLESELRRRQQLEAELAALHQRLSHPLPSVAAMVHRSNSNDALADELELDSSGSALVRGHEDLRSRVKQHEGQINSLLRRVEELTLARDALSNEVVLARANLAEVSRVADRVAPLEAELEALAARHDVALEIIGEKEDELAELRERIAALPRSTD
jgi:chromosome segregation ATPase